MIKEALLGIFLGIAVGLLVGGSLIFLVKEASADPPAKICGDVNGDAEITASDALRVLYKAVGLDVKMRCNNRRNYGDENLCLNEPCTVTIPKDLHPE